MSIEELRNEIDKLDDALLKIFNDRAALAIRIGSIKKKSGLSVFDPEREKKIFLRMKSINPGPLDDQAIVRLFERVIDESRRLERIMNAQDKEE